MLTKKEIFNLNEILTEINVPATFQFNYMVKRNKDKFSTVVKNLPVFQPPKSKEYDEYLTAVKKKIEDEKITFKNIQELNTFYEKELENYPKAKDLRSAAIDQHKIKVEEWEKEKVDLELYLLQNKESIPDGLTQEQFEIILEYFTKKEENL